MNISLALLSSVYTDSIIVQQKLLSMLKSDNNNGIFVNINTFDYRK